MLRVICIFCVLFDGEGYCLRDVDESYLLVSRGFLMVLLLGIVCEMLVVMSHVGLC